MKQVRDRVAVITGAGSGIGRATALRFASAGCHLALVDRSAEGLEGTAALLRSSGRYISLHTADVANEQEMFALPEAVTEAHGGAHILINNAGVTGIGRFEEESMDNLRWIVGINIWGVIYGCKAFLPTLQTAEEAHIVNLSSMAAFVGLPLTASYSMTKGAVRLFSEALRAELRDTNIGVTSVHPGAIDTNIIQDARGEGAAFFRSKTETRLKGVIMRSPDAVARKILRAVEHDRARVLVGPDAIATDLLSRLIPARSGVMGRMADRFIPRTK